MSGAGATSTRRHPVASCALVALLLGLAAPVSARTIGPDAYGYTATDQVPFSFVDISSTGTRVLAGTDGGTYLASIGFTFNFYGLNRVTAIISTNGYLYFPPQGSGSNVGVAVLSDDWQFFQAGADAVYVQTVGSPGDRQFIVQWNKAFGYPSSPSDVTFEAVFSEKSGSVLLQYADTDSGDTRSMGGHAVVATYMSGPVLTLVWSSLSPVIGNDLAILFARACGNGTLDAGEQCDDGNVLSCDGCSSACQTEPPLVCGDGILVAGCEACDDGNLVDGDGCDSNCTRTACGNAIVTAGEQCDDGNRRSCDGCSSTCQNEPGFVCGDGVRNPNCGEGCDDGNLVDGDGCDSNCRPTGCGNGIVTAGEQCDDGNTYNCDGCSSTCQNELGFRCGDGILNATCEQCDDGNRTAGDGCDSYCRTEHCFVCAGTAPTVCTAVTTCAGGDDCCPAVCTRANDSDCSPIAPLGAEFQVNRIVNYKINSVGYEGPDVAADAAGDFVVVWRDYKENYSYNSYGSSRVMGRRFDNRGNPRSSDFVVGRFGSDGYTNGRDISVSANADGRFVVVWGEYNEYYGRRGQDTDVAGKMFSSNLGTPLSGGFLVNSYTIHYQENPRVAVGPGGEFVVIWNSDQAEDTAYDVWGRRFDNMGRASGDDFEMNTTTDKDEGDNGELAVAADPTGNFVVVWGGNRPNGVRGQRFTNAGTPLGPEFAVSSYTGDDNEFPAVATDASGNFVVAWLHEFAGVVGRQFNSAGNPTSTEFQVSTFAQPDTSDYVGPAVASDPSGNFAVVWSGYGSSDSFDVFARFFDATGAAQGEEFRVNSSVPGDQQFPAVASIGSSEFVVVWTDNGSSDSRVVGRRIGLFLPQNLTLAGSRLRIRNSVPENKEHNLGTWSTVDPAIVAGERATMDDPRCNGDPPGSVRARLRFFSSSSGHDTGDIGLPCQNWTAIGLEGGYKYQDPELDDGPCKLVSINTRRQVRAQCLGSGPTTDFPYDLVPGTTEGTVNVVLTTGQIRYCTSFGATGGRDGSDGKLFQGRKAPPPPACPS